MTDKEMFLARYRVYHKGTMIYGCDSLNRCKDLVKEMEAEDVEDGVYVTNSYKIEKTPRAH